MQNIINTVTYYYSISEQFIILYTLVEILMSTMMHISVTVSPDLYILGISKEATVTPHADSIHETIV